jgi:hypothetical protein
MGRVDEITDQRWRGSSSLAKKIGAAFRISLASFKSRTSACRLIAASSSQLGPCRSPGSTWVCSTPLAQRLCPDTQLWSQRLRGGPHRRVAIELIKNHPGRTLTPVRWLPLRHDLHPSQARKRHEIRDGSRSRIVSVRPIGHPRTERGWERLAFGHGRGTTP